MTKSFTENGNFGVYEAQRPDRGETVSLALSKSKKIVLLAPPQLTNSFLTHKN